MRRGASLLALAVLGAVAGGAFVAFSAAAEEPGGSVRSASTPGASRTLETTSTRRIDLDALTPAFARGRELSRRAGKRPRSRGPIVFHRDGCRRARWGDIHLELTTCEYGAYTKQSLRPNADTGYWIHWTQYAARATGGWCLTGASGSEQVGTSRVLSSTPRGRVDPGRRAVEVRIHDPDGNGLGRMWAENVNLAGGELSGRVRRLPEGDKSRWRWTGSIRKRKLRFTIASAVSFPIPDGGLIYVKGSENFRTSFCGAR